MRRMSDTPHLSDILQPHQHPCSPVRCPESSPCRHYRRLERAHAPAPDRKLAAPPGPCDRGGTPASRPARLVQPVPNPSLSSVGSDDRGCGGMRAGPGADGRQTDRARCQVRCRERCLFISNMVTLSLPKTLLSLSSARISRRFSGFCRLWDLMYSQTLLTTSPRGSGPGPTTAASASDGCSGRCSAFPLPLLAVAFSAFFGVSCDVLVGIVHLRFAPPFLHAVERRAAGSAPIMATACGRVLGATRRTPPAALYFGVRQQADAMDIVRSSGFPLGRLLLGPTTPDGGR